MAVRPPKSNVINPTDILNKQTNNQDIALELVKSYLSSGAYKNKKLNSLDEVSGPSINVAANLDALYISSLYIQTKGRLDKLIVK